eukprot:CAMPEP_0115559232 /NCGR_PEP_ID=MMETSP0271-20121206/99853_1 /TAXON_ID=71861 /ORGANISM="Scrippsiella trochoidea, Strain CCMP3099" /LENGTH=237 /DNA_ID=CAMNT_0002993283 /DNA_START=88 /DNA_END=801 /DNA_ORIENTATION=-
MANSTTKLNSNGWFRGLLGTSIPKHAGIYKLHLQAQATLETGDIRASVRLPVGVGRDEWIASQMIGISRETMQVINVLEDVCCEKMCPRMTAGEHVTYLWSDEKNPQPQVVSAPEYMKNLVLYTESKLSDRRLFPIDGSALPPEFINEVTTMCRRLFRVYAHAYLSHFQAFQDNEAEAHLNCYFKHFLYFVLEFGLVDRQDIQPLAELIKKFLTQDDKKDGKSDRPGYSLPYSTTCR